MMAGSIGVGSLIEDGLQPSPEGAAIVADALIVDTMPVHGHCL